MLLKALFAMLLVEVLGPSIVPGRLASFGPSVASAHGRPPQVYDVLPTGEGRPSFAGSFGLVVPAEGGYRWACSSAQSRSASEDPAFVRVSDGGFLGGTYRGLVHTNASGCGTEIVQPDLERVVIDVVRSPAGTLWLVTSDGRDIPNGVYRSDDGESFVPGNAEIEPILFERIRVANDEQTVYLSGAYPRTVVRTEREIVVHRSVDAGVNWDRFVFAHQDGERALFLLEVDADDPATVYAYLQREFDRYEVPERVVVSRDGGESWETLFEIAGAFGAFAIDGDTTYVGATQAPSFENAEGELIAPEFGLWRSEGGSAFESVRDDVSIHCLVPWMGELWACSSSLLGEFDVGRSSDGGTTFTEEFSIADLLGPSECGEEQTATCFTEDRDLVRDYGLSICLEPPCDPPVEPSGGGCSTSISTGLPFGGAAALIFLVFLTRRRRRV